MSKTFDELRATLVEKAQENEGNAFTKALNAARKAGDSHFVVSGKRYKCEDYDESGNIKEAAKCPDCDMAKDDCECDHDVKEATDPVKDKEAKKKFADRDDKDIDNDGDVDSSDKFLHRRRKAIAKDKTKDEPQGEKGETATMNPKKKEEATKESFRSKLLSIWEDAAGEKRKKDQNKDAGADANSGSAKAMKDGHGKPEVNNDDEKGHDDAAKAGRNAPQAKARNGGDQTNSGDRNVVNKIAAAYKGMK